MKNSNQSPDESMGNEIPEPMPIDIIRNCGRQQLPIDRLLLILHDKFPHDFIRLSKDLERPGTEAYDAYYASWAHGEMDLGDALMKNAINAEKDGYKSLSQERTRQAVNRALEKNFGIDS